MKTYSSELPIRIQYEKGINFEIFFYDQKNNYFSQIIFESLLYFITLANVKVRIIMLGLIK